MLRGQRSGVRGELFITITTTTTIINTTVIVITVLIKVTKADLNSIIMDPDDAPCYCDHNCLNMGDCCPDFKDYCGGIFALTLAFINEIMMMVMIMMMMLLIMIMLMMMMIIILPYLPPLDRPQGPPQLLG